VNASLRGDRREQDRELELLAEELEPGIDRAHVDEHARPETNRVERLAVAAQRDLVRRPLCHVVPDRTREALACQRLELEDVDGRRARTRGRTLRERNAGKRAAGQHTDNTGGELDRFATLQGRIATKGSAP
jgi:hypothetical protein